MRVNPLTHLSMAGTLPEVPVRLPQSRRPACGSFEPGQIDHALGPKRCFRESTAGADEPSVIGVWVEERS